MPVLNRYPTFPRSIRRLSESASRADRHLKPMVATGLLLIAVTTTGCASMEPTKSGYLASYSDLKKGDSDNVLQAGPAPGQLAAVTAFVVEPPQWRASSDRSARFDDAQRQDVLGTLQDALREELKELRPLFSTGDTTTLIIRSAVTDAERSNPAVNVATSFLIGPVTNGGATIEFEAIRSDGSRVAAMVYADTGGVLDLFDAYSEAGHARQVTKRAAAAFRKLLAEGDTKAQ